MKPYGRNEYIGLRTVDDVYPDAADIHRLGNGRRSKKSIRRLMKKKVRALQKRSTLQYNE